MPIPAPPRDWRDALGAALRERRKAAGMSQERLGLEVARPWRKAVHRNTVSRIERGLTNFRIEMLIDLVNEIDGDVAALFARAGELLAGARTGSIDERPPRGRGPLHFAATS